MPKHTGPRSEGSPCWVDLSAPDVDAAQRFYAAVMGWSFQGTSAEYGGYRMASKGGQPAAGLGPVQGDAPPVWTIYFAAADVDALTARAKQLGGMVIAEPFEVQGQGRMSVVADPTGAVFGLWQALEHTGFGASEEPGFFVWCEVNTTDAERAREFYSQLFGAGATETPNPSTTYYVLSKDGKDLGGILQMNEQWEGIPPHWMPYFQVADIGAAVAAAKAEGGTVAVEPFDTPYGRIAVVGDPAMAPFSLMQR